MSYAINHVHIRAKDPHASAKWYEKFFGAQMMFSKEIMPGTITIGLAMDGPVSLNISTAPAGSSDERGYAELNHLGLEHFGFSVVDVNREIKRLEESAVRIVMPTTELIGGAKIAYIEGPDDVLIELVQAPE